MTRVTITKFERDPRGFFTARVTADGETITVDNRIGPWTAPVDPYADHGSNKVTRREVIPEVAVRLRARARGGAHDESPLDVTRREPRRTFRAPEPAPRPRTQAEQFAQKMAAAGAAAITKEAA
jgi:hypothetical protein